MTAIVLQTSPVLLVLGILILILLAWAMNYRNQETPMEVFEGFLRYRDRKRSFGQIVRTILVILLTVVVAVFLARAYIPGQGFAFEPQSPLIPREELIDDSKPRPQIRSAKTNEQAPDTPPPPPRIPELPRYETGYAPFYFAWSMADAQSCMDSLYKISKKYSLTIVDLRKRYTIPTGLPPFGIQIGGLHQSDEAAQQFWEEYLEVLSIHFNRPIRFDKNVARVIQIEKKIELEAR